MYAAFPQTQIKASIKHIDKPEMEEADHSSMLIAAMFSEAAANAWRDLGLVQARLDGWLLQRKQQKHWAAMTAGFICQFPDTLRWTSFSHVVCAFVTSE